MLHAWRERTGKFARRALSDQHPAILRTRRRMAGEEPAEMTAVLGQKPPAQKSAIEDFDKRIVDRGGPVVVLNDEAHHTHDEESEWNKIVRALHADVSGGVAAQFDFTATPRHSKGQLFSWTVFDYPLKQAIIDNVVKRPLKGIAQGISEQRSDVASTRYEAYLAAGVERWKEYREQLEPARQEAGVVRDDERHRRRRRRGRLVAEEISLRIRRRQAADHSHRQIRRGVEKGFGQGAKNFPRNRRREKSGQLHRQRADAARGLGRAKRHGHRRFAAVYARRPTFCPNRPSDADCA